METVSAGGGAGTAIAGAGLKISHVLLDWIAPIGAAMAGFSVGDLGIYGLIKSLTDMFVPANVLQNNLVNVIWILTAIAYFGLAYFALRLPYIGRILAGFLAGAGARSLFRDLKGPLAALKPAGA